MRGGNGSVLTALLQQRYKMCVDDSGVINGSSYFWDDRRFMHGICMVMVHSAESFFLFVGLSSMHHSCQSQGHMRRGT